MNQMIENKWLGNKTGQGFYKQDFVDGQRVFLTLDPETMEYIDGGSPRFDSISATRKIEDLGERLRKFLEFDDRAANYARDILFYGFAYAAYVAQEIAYKLSDIDDAMRWEALPMKQGRSRCGTCWAWPKPVEKMEAAGLEVAPVGQRDVGGGLRQFLRERKLLRLGCQVVSTVGSG
ncbi:MAG: hypothetical protein M5U34_47840 [Chloroflexi bacterium]|nr:hypothetical protein [Chloroflexota bacterium]